MIVREAASLMPNSGVPSLDWSPSDLEGCHSSLLALHEYWRGKCGGRLLPSRSDIDPVDLKRILPELILIDVVPDSRRYVYRLVGTHEVEMRGSDPTGKAVQDAYYAESADQTLLYLDRAVQTRRPVLYRGTYQPTSTRTQEEDVIFLPLSQDGENVNMILVYGRTEWVREDSAI